nr:MAG TPA: hypothetical protein [Caudoviricetes sp.]
MRLYRLFNSHTVRSVPTQRTVDMQGISSSTIVEITLITLAI